MQASHTIRAAQAGDLQAALALLPELADFNVPERRQPEHLWQSDALLLRAILAGHAERSFSDVAVNAQGALLGIIIVTLRDELLSHAPSAHLEAIVVAPNARGRGLGRSLLKHAEHRARERGALSLTLHVFANNTRARALYDQAGYDSELIRAVKWFD